MSAPGPLDRPRAIDHGNPEVVATHSPMLPALAPGVRARPATPPAGASPSEPPRFEHVYRETFPFVWRSLRRLGVPAEQVDDAAQEVFIVVARRMPEFEGRSRLETWIFGIAMRVASEARRSHARSVRRVAAVSSEPPPAPAEAPDAHLLRRERESVLAALLSELDEPKRQAFVLCELEGHTGPAAAEALGVNENTLYARLRAARRELEETVQRWRAEGRLGAPGGEP